MYMHGQDHDFNRPDLTFAVDFVLKTNDLSTLHKIVMPLASGSGSKEVNYQHLQCKSV